MTMDMYEEPELDMEEPELDMEGEKDEMEEEAEDMEEEDTEEEEEEEEEEDTEEEEEDPYDKYTLKEGEEEEEEEDLSDFYNDLDRRYRMEMEAEDNKHHVGLPDVKVRVSFHDYGISSARVYYRTHTVGYLISSIKFNLVPTEGHYHDGSSEDHRIKDGAMFVFQGEDLCTKDPSLTLDDLGMEGLAHVLIFYPGTVSEGASTSTMTSELHSLVEKTVSSAKDDSIAQLLKNLEVSCEEKAIFVEIPVFDGTDLVISIKKNLDEKIEKMKSNIRRFLLSTSDDPWQKLPLEAFDLFYNGLKLDTESSLARYEVAEHCHLKFYWNHRCAEVSVPLHITTLMLDAVFKVAPSDTVGKLKVRVHQLSGVPPEKQLLFHENRWSLQTYKFQRLVQCGISFFSFGFFPWAPRNCLLEVLPLFFYCDHRNLDDEVGLRSGKPLSHFQRFGVGRLQQWKVVPSV